MESTIEMTPVTSSLLKAVGYDAEKQELHVHFNKGGEYIYHDVPKEAHEAFVSAPSHGKHFLSVIKPTFTKFTKKG
jgi:hypothetical protein